MALLCTDPDNVRRQDIRHHPDQTPDSWSIVAISGEPDYRTSMSEDNRENAWRELDTLDTLAFADYVTHNARGAPFVQQGHPRAPKGPEEMI